MNTPNNAAINRPYWQGFVSGLPFLLVVGPFGLLFGVAATEAGLDLIQTMSMTILVVAGASQFAAVQLLQDNAPLLVVVFTGLAVNLRLAMYSASIAPHLGSLPVWQRATASYMLVDQSYAASVLHYESQPQMTPQQKLRFFFGVITPIWPVWVGSTYLGVVAGAAIPPQYALDFAVPITFISLVAPALRSLPHLAAAFVSVSVALALAWMPYNLWLLIAALLAMITGAWLEQHLAAKAKLKNQNNKNDPIRAES